MSKPRHISILEEALAIQKERGAKYGGVEENFTSTAEIASAMFGADVQPWDICMILAAVKLARTRGGKAYQDNYLDAINYIAFAAGFAQEDEEEEGDDGEGDEIIPPSREEFEDFVRQMLQTATGGKADALFGSPPPGSRPARFEDLPPRVREAVENVAAMTGQRPEDIPVWESDNDKCDDFPNCPCGTKH
jgi:hypothetical protein